MFVSFEQTRNFGVSKKGVHTFEETGVQDVRFIHDETDLFALAAGTTEDSTEIFVEVLTGIFIRYLDLEDAQTIHPGDETRESSLRIEGKLISNQSQSLGKLDLPFHYHRHQ